MPEPDREPPFPDPNEFDGEDADVDPRLELRSSFSEALARQGFPDTHVVARERAGELLHDRRLELLDHLADNEPTSVRALADAVGYDKGLVSRDLQKLASIDVVEYVAAGRAKAPRLKHEHVVVEPIV